MERCPACDSFIQKSEYDKAMAVTRGSVSNAQQVRDLVEQLNVANRRIEKMTADLAKTKKKG